MTTKVEEKERADTSEKSPEKGPQRFDILPAWLGDSLHSRKSWKLVFRCWFASWVSFVILLPHSSLKELGNASVSTFPITSSSSLPTLPVIILAVSLPFSPASFYHLTYQYSSFSSGVLHSRIKASQ